jgi:phage replication O-like protein O
VANPQLENGYTKIANEIIENLARINLSPYENRLLMAIIRMTYGWGKKTDFVSISQLGKLTKLDRRNISRTKLRLLHRKLIKQTDSKLSFNKNYDEWTSSLQTTNTIVYRDTRLKFFPPPGYSFKHSDETLCEYCFKKIRYNKLQVQRHHIIPKSLGGKDINENTIRLCIPCHLQIHKELHELNIVSIDAAQHYYRQFVSKVSSRQTQFLSSIKTTTKEKNINKITKENIYSQDAQKVLDYLNQKKGSKYKKKDEIMARLKEGYTCKDCFLIIDNKSLDEYFIDNPKYLNPVTLFRKSHFDIYLNDTPSKKKTNMEKFAELAGGKNE